MNKAEEFISTWLDKKYSGAKELGDWTPNDVVEIMDEYAQQVSKEREKKVFNDARMDFIGYRGRQYKYENFDVWEEEQENE